MENQSAEQGILLESVRRVVKERIAPRAVETDRIGLFDHETADLFWDLGLFQIMLPEEYGGWPESPGHTLCLCIEEIAKVCASSALMLLIQAVGSFPLVTAGGEKQKGKYLPWLSEGRTLTGDLVTEPGAGSDVAAIRTRAERRGGKYVLSGRKTFATNGGVSIGRTEEKCGFRHVAACCGGSCPGDRSRSPGSRPCLRKGAADLWKAVGGSPGASVHDGRCGHQDRGRKGG